MDAELDDTEETEEACFERLMQHKYADGKFLCQCGHTNAYKIKRARMKCKECGKSKPKLKKNKNEPFQCHHCGSSNAEEIAGPIILECAKCGKQTSLTAGTIFHGAKISLDKISHILSEMGQGVIKSAAVVAGELGIAISTAYRNMQKVRRVMDQSCASDETMEEVHRSFFQEILFRRSTESPPTFSETLSKFESRHIREDAPVELFEHSLASSLVDFVRNGFQGTSRKKFQLFAGQFNYVIRYADHPEKLTELCFRATRLTDREITCYSSPQLIRVVIAKSNCRPDLLSVSEGPSRGEWGLVSSGATMQPCLA